MVQVLPLKKVNAIPPPPKTPLLHHDLTSCVACQRFHSRPLIALAKSRTTELFEKKTPGITPMTCSIRYQKRCAFENVSPLKHYFSLISTSNLREGSGIPTFGRISLIDLSSMLCFGELTVWPSFDSVAHLPYIWAVYLELPPKLPSCAGK